MAVMKRPSPLKAAAFLFTAMVIGLLVRGGGYYLAQPQRKPRLPLHAVLTSGGSWGHPLGIIGTLFMVLLLAYSLRKRLRFMKNWGKLNVWLDVHIFLGLTGPILVLFHTDFKFSGIIGISFWSMVLVVLSGIIGRYIYQSIPRSLSGMELNRIELEAEEIGLTFELRKWLPREDPLWAVLTEMEAKGTSVSTSRILFPFVDMWTMGARLRRSLKKTEILEAEPRRKLSKLIMSRQVLLRRKLFLDRTMRVLHYWHLMHLPVVILMFTILIVHVYVAVRMGYRWIF
jgi:hypothetical protein